MNDAPPGQAASSALASTQPVTLRDVARYLGVSPKTVSQVIRCQPGASEETRQRVWQAVAALGYRPNASARALRHAPAGAPVRRDCLGFLIRRRFMSNTDSFYYAVLAGVELEAVERGQSVLFSAIDEHWAPGAEVPRWLLEQLVDAVMLVGAAPAALLAAVAVRGLPVVTVDWENPQGRFDAVVTDNVAAARRAVEYLVDFGHRDIACLIAAPGRPSLAQRAEGYRQALHAAGLPVRDDRVLVVRTQALADELEEAWVRVRTALTPPGRPTALFAGNDRLAAAAVRAAREFGLDVPGDVSIVGFDDMPLASQLAPPLTTMRVPKEELGRLAVRRLLERLGSPHMAPTITTVQATLIQRQSAAPPTKVVT